MATVGNHCSSYALFEPQRIETGSSGRGQMTFTLICVVGMCRKWSPANYNASVWTHVFLVGTGPEIGGIPKMNPPLLVKGILLAFPE